MEHSVISPYTSFVAVEERQKEEIVQKTVDIETLLSAIEVDSLPYVGYSKVLKSEVFSLKLLFIYDVESVLGWQVLICRCSP